MNTHLLYANSIRIKKFQSLTSYFLHIYSCHLHFHQAKSWFEIVLCVEKSSNHCILTTYQYQRGRIYCLSIKLVSSSLTIRVCSRQKFKNCHGGTNCIHPGYIPPQQVRNLLEPYMLGCKQRQNLTFSHNKLLCIVILVKDKF